MAFSGQVGVASQAAKQGSGVCSLPPEKCL